MALFLWYLVKSYLSSVRYCTRVHWKIPFLQGTRNTRSMFNWSPFTYITGGESRGGPQQLPLEHGGENTLRRTVTGQH